MRNRYILLSLLLALSVPSWGQSLEECLDFAMKNSLRIQRTNLSAERASTLEKTAYDVGKTELSLAQDPTSGGSPDNALTLSQEFEFPSVYSGRRKLLEAGTQVEQTRRLLTESELRRDVSSAYCDLLLKSHLVELLKQNALVLEEFVNIAQARFDAGESGKLETINALQMKAANEIRLREATDDRREASLMLRVLMNSEKEIEPTDGYICVMEDDGEYSFGSTPEGLLLDKELDLSERNLSLTRREGFLPTFNVGVRQQLVISGLNPYNIDRSAFDKGNWMGFEVGVALPLFFGPQKRKVAAARLEMEMLKTDMAEKQNVAMARLSVASDKLSTARETYRYYSEEALPQAEEQRRLSALEYSSGNIGYVDYIQNINVVLETEMAGARAADELNQAIIEMNFIKGN